MTRVICYRNDRLGTALMNLCCAWEFADRHGYDFECWWQDAHPVRGPFSLREILDWDDLNPPFTLVEGARKWPEEAYRLDKHLGHLKSPSLDIRTMTELPSSFLYILTRCILDSETTRDAAEERARQLFRSLKLQPTLRERINLLDAHFAGLEFTAVHMRRGDIVDGVHRFAETGEGESAISTFCARYADVSAYRRAIDSQSLAHNILLFSDDPDAEEEFIRESGLAVSRIPDFATDGLTEMQRDFLEIYLMSRASAIVAGRSVFSGFAAFLSQAPLVQVRPWLRRSTLEADLHRRFGGKPFGPRAVSMLLEQFEAVKDFNLDSNPIYNIVHQQEKSSPVPNIRSEPLGFDEIRSLLGKDDPLIFEIGAHAGIHTKRFLDAFPNCRIHCFEPDKRAYEYWERLVRDPRASIHKVAVGARDEIATWHVSGGLESDSRPQGYDKSSSLRPPKNHLEKYPWVTFEKTVQVPCIRLDSWADENRIDHVDFIWADVQGAEGDLIDGAKSVLNRTRYFYTEYSNSEMYEGQINLNEILERLPNFRVKMLFHEDVLLERVY